MPYGNHGATGVLVMQLVVTVADRGQDLVHHLSVVVIHVQPSRLQGMEIRIQALKLVMSSPVQVKAYNTFI